MTEMTDTTATPRGERTREATDRKLMRATLQIAVDRGISGVTIEEVARRSGVAKTTITADIIMPTSCCTRSARCICTPGFRPSAQPHA